MTRSFLFLSLLCLVAQAAPSAESSAVARNACRSQAHDYASYRDCLKSHPSKPTASDQREQVIAIKTQQCMKEAKEKNIKPFFAKDYISACLKRDDSKAGVAN